MTTDDSFSDPRLQTPTDDPVLRPSDRTCRWLFWGMWAVLADGALWVTSSFLELAFWNRDGLTPDVIVGYLAFLPEVVVLGAWLVLAREAASGGLWKSAIGYMGSFWLMGLLLLVLEELLNDWGNTAVLIATGIGIVAMVVLLFAPKPGWDAQRRKNSETQSRGKTEDGDRGCFGHIVVVIVLFLLRGGLRKLNRQFPALQFGPDLWTMVALAAVILLILTFGIRLAVAKIRLRQTLGTLAAWLGAAELLFIVLHLAAVAAFLVFLATNVQPQLNDQDIERMIDPWLRTGTIVSAVCYAIWTMLTAVFFSSIRSRGALDWRQEFLFPDNRPA
jgi:hypothetical protein